MKTSRLTILLSSFLYTLLSFTSVAQGNKINSIANTLNEVVITVSDPSITDRAFFTKNKKKLRKAARLSKGNIDKFKHQITSTLPTIESKVKNDWDELYSAAQQLTLTGKLDSFPSAL